MKIEVVEGLGGVEARDWDALVGDGAPFLEWAFLRSLEETGCVSREAGWLPQHLLLKGGRRLAGAVPLYVKGHSQGEFVFDHGLADAAERAGIRYYPKLLAATPFTPATGARLLVHPDADRAATRRLLAAGLRQVCERGGFSSVHVNFCLEEEIDALAKTGFLRRTGVQFQWKRRGWSSFEDWMAALRGKRRTQFRRERNELEAQGIVLDVLAGDAIWDPLVDVMYDLYLTTVDKFVWGQRYLTIELFRALAERWRERLVFVIARRGEEIVAGTFNVRKGTVLYGRYWGAFETLRFLHFNVCYYAPIEWGLANGIERFEPGAGGEFKHLRGFEGTPTESMHWFADPRLHSAVADFFVRERRAVDRSLTDMGELSAYRRGE